jgi:type II secretory ATPase GspE/PulE/Tfp pilus assembly ATPase PilB-like protein
MRYDLVLVGGREVGIPYAARPDAELAAPRRRSLWDLVPLAFAVRHTVLPLDFDGETLTVAMAAPTDAATLKLLRLITRCDLQPLAATRAQIRTAIARYYRSEEIC